MRAMSAAERFERNVERLPWSGCWLWVGCTNSSGYGTICVDRKMVNAHRFSWAMHNGPIAPGAHVLHRCDVPSCVNPDHLFLGDRQANFKDARAKGRMPATFKDGACRNGHAETADNIEVWRERNGRRRVACRLCRNAARNARYARREK